MGFRNGAYAMIWELENKGKYHVAKMSTSKLNKETGKYEKDWSDQRVRLIGDAHTVACNFGDKTKVKIGSCDVTTKYDAEKNVTYTNYIIFSFEESGADSNPTSSSLPTTASGDGFMSIPNVTDEELPFN